MTITTEDLFMDLDRSGPIPLYYQVARRMQDAIESGDLPPGARIENELKLAEHLGISRPTIRRAIQELVNQGLLVRRRGVGTQVVRGRLTRSVELTSLFDDLSLSHRSPSTTVLIHEAIVPSGEILESLTLPADTEVLHIKRLRFTDGVPFALLENYLPPEFLTMTAESLEKRGLYQLMRSRGTTMKVARQTIGARTASKEEATLFNQKPGSSVLTMSRTLFDQSGHAVEFGVHSYRPDLYSFEVTLVEK
ncbi:MAG: GntR family transcriptional regulator [Subtercola sp.]|jgi:DNA-binding GntR family transcriptional regulator|nr:GntR family transcriptional regulator [Subtercola sp.]